MEVINWEKLDKTSFDFSAGTGISTGSFDGFHKGHRTLIEELVQKCKKQNLLPGIVTFTRPLPSYKHNDSYYGDVCSLNQRLQILESFGISFVILVDFNPDFAALTGEQYFSKLIQLCNLKYIAEGVDFRCGYKGATDMEKIKAIAADKKLITSFTEPVFDLSNGEKLQRISSSFIREIIKKGHFEEVHNLLKRDYGIEIEKENCKFFENYISVEKQKVLQVLPENGNYSCKSSIGEEEFTVEIRDFELLIKSSSFTKIVSSLSYEKFVIYFQKPGD